MPTPRVDGIDISHWNVVTDEHQIPPYPLMSCKATDGSTFVSPKFADFWAMFDRLDVRYRGAYHWVRSTTSMRSQVDHLARTLDAVGGLRTGDFVQLDWETTPGIANMTAEQIEEWVSLARARWGDRVIVYGSDWVPDFLKWRKANPSVPVWYANYNTGTSATGGWAECAKYKAAVWQWSSTWKVPGFLWNPDEPTDGVDVNHVFDWATLDRLCLLEPPDPPPPDEEVDMLRKAIAPQLPAAPAWWPYLGCFDSGVVRPLVSGDLDPVDGVHFLTDEGQYRRLAVAAGVDLTNEMPDGAADDITIEVPPFEVPVLKLSGTIGPA